MAKLELRNIARHRKTYPFSRRKPVWKYLSDKPGTIENATIEFNGESEKIYVLKEEYSSAPPIVLGVDPENEAVNVFVDTISTTQATVGVTGAFVGKVYLQIVEFQS